MSRSQNHNGGSPLGVRLLWATIFAAIALAGTASGQQSNPVLKEDWDGTSINSTYHLTSSGGTAADVLATGGPNGNVLRITHLDIGNNNSIAWDYVNYGADQVVISFLVSMSDDAANTEAGGCCGEAADGFGIGLFGTPTYGATGPSNPAAPFDVNWEDPTFTGSGFPNAIVFGFDVFDSGGPLGNQIRVTGLDGSGDVLLNQPAPFPINNGLFHKVIATLESDGDGGGILSMAIVEDFYGAGIMHEFIINTVVPGIDPNLFEGRLIAGGRTGSSFVETLLDCVQIETFGFSGAPPTFSKQFAPSTVAPGSVSTLTFTIGNESPDGVRGLDFVDVLPPGMVVAAVPNIVTDCEGIVTATPGGDTITMLDGRVPANGSCTISVNVTTTGEAGVYTNISRPLTSDAGSSGSAIAELTVDSSIPGFSKSFQPSTISLNERSTLTFTVDNTANQIARYQGAFTDNLPAGIVVANPPNIVSTCGGTVTAIPGSSTISLATDFANPTTVGANETCTISVDVIGAAVGNHQNVTDEFTSSAGIGGDSPQSSGTAVATLAVVGSSLVFSKSFVDDPVPPNGMARLEFTITNRDRNLTATDIAFTDDLSTILPGLVSVSNTQTDICGPGSLIGGTEVITFKGGQLAPGASCTFGIGLRVPKDAVPGAYLNQTSPLEGRLDSSPVLVSPATDTLFVSPVPRLTKEFLDSPVIPGGRTRLQFTVFNTSPSAEATDIAFTDELTTFLPFPLSVTLPKNGFCGPDSAMSLISLGEDRQSISMSGGSLSPGESCTFEVIIDIPLDQPTGIYTNTTDPPTAMVRGESVSGSPASADLQIVSGPRLTKRFVDPPARPGHPIKLEFTLSYPDEAPDTAYNISFTDDLDNVIPGMVAVDLPKSDICGTGSTLSGKSVITFSGGRLKPGEACSFIVVVEIPAEASPGTYTNTTSAVSAEVARLSVASPPASADLVVTNILLEKSFSEPFVAPGEIVNLTFTLRNGGTQPATDIAFIDDLESMIPGLRALKLPFDDICGAGSSLTQSAGGQLIFAGGSLAANSTCSFTFSLQVPLDVEDDVYRNITSGGSATVEGVTFDVPDASAELEVTSLWIELTKRFLTNPANPGQVVGLEFTLQNLDKLLPITDIAFTDALPSGLVAISGTQTDICGAGSLVSGSTTISFTGGRLAANGSCTFSVDVEVSAEATPGEIENVTSEVTGSNSTVPVRGDPARATLIVEMPPPPGGLVAINNITRPGDGTTVLTLTGAPEVRYCLQWSDNLINWFDAPTVIVGDGNPATVTDDGPPEFPPPPPSGKRFYRLIEKVAER